MVQQQAAMLSFVEAFRIMGYLFLAIVPLVLLMRPSPPRRAPPPAPSSRRPGEAPGLASVVIREGARVLSCGSFIKPGGA